MQASLQELETKLKSPISFPSPPGIAQKIIEIAGDPDATIATIADTVSKDPGLTAKILRTANSPMYAQRRKSENLRQALIVLGLNAATTLALSFSLVASFKSTKTTGLDYPRYWRRSLLCALTARTLGDQLKLNAGENLFLASLLQDIAVAAIDRIKSDFYSALPQGASHREVCEYERARLGVDHARVSTLLLTSWKLPEQICAAIEASHDPARAPRSTPAGLFARCVGCASEIVEVFLSHDPKAALPGLEALTSKLLGLTRAQLGDVLATITRTMPEIEQLFDTNLLDTETTSAIMSNAHEMLAQRSLEALERESNLQRTAEDLADQGRRDALTGVFNRGHLDQRLPREFESAIKNDWPLSVVFVDLDHFKRINDTYGHAAGDAVLRATATTLANLIRENDVLARYGGEEFVVVMPGTTKMDAAAACQRILKKLRETPHDFGGEKVVVTASLGLATHDAQTPFAKVEELLENADRNVYAAKRAGRDRLSVGAGAVKAPATGSR